MLIQCVHRVHLQALKQAADDANRQGQKENTGEGQNGCDDIASLSQAHWD